MNFTSSQRKWLENQLHQVRTMLKNQTCDSRDTLKAKREAIILLLDLPGPV